MAPAGMRIVGKELHAVHQAGGEHDRWIGDCLQPGWKVHLPSAAHPAEHRYRGVQVDTRGQGGARHQGNGLHGFHGKDPYLVIVLRRLCSGCGL